MIETCYFKCPNRGDMLAIYFDEREEITLDFLAPFLTDGDFGRYIELIFKNGGKHKIATLIRSELNNQVIIDETLDMLFSDNLQEIKANEII